MLLGMYGETDWMSVYSQDFRDALNGGGLTDSFLRGWDGAAPDDIARVMASDTLGYIPECLNPKVDIASMACGLEVRSPFLDQELVEFCARIPSRMKIKGFRQKHILKRAFSSELPTQVLNRGKAGFGMPLANWLRNELRASAEELLTASISCISDLIQPNKITTMFADHLAGSRNWHIQLWRLLVLETWLRENKARSQFSEYPTPLTSALTSSRAPFANAG